LIGPGKVEITVTTRDGRYSDSIWVTVKTDRYALTISESLESIGGYVNVNGARAGGGQQFDMASGAIVALKAEPYEGYKFVRWECENSDAKFDRLSAMPWFAMPDGDVSVSPVFELTFKPAAFLYGDVDGNGRVAPMDATLLSRYLAGWPGVVINRAAADVDGDGEVTPFDLAILQRHIAGWPGYEVLPHIILNRP
ncbi:MAG: dockerin type I domain-containing protein, partial [Clostridiales bacterium]|nr:dockerin type I domain-containing protein [Clostridiales bacterium]